MPDRPSLPLLRYRLERDAEVSFTTLAAELPSKVDRLRRNGPMDPPVLYVDAADDLRWAEYMATLDALKGIGAPDLMLAMELRSE